jgi:hypothetical protein
MTEHLLSTLGGPFLLERIVGGPFLLLERIVGGPFLPATFRKQVVTSWYAWAQEFYCDAVGLTIGGPCYLNAFSHFFRTRSNDQYYVPRDKQLERRHPVTWLRTKMLVDRARKLGMVTLADSVQDTWAETARVLGVQEDYEGTWAEEFFLPLRQMLDAMIEESQPYAHRPPDIILPGDEAKSLSPIQLCNLSWGKFEEDRKSYRAWEKGAIESFLRGA